ncbi:molecular chaperone [Altererythrobacter sp. ZODW24]|uniref:fimbrial biogenesis chaperone n=1 Tax=Altererythrobacter sp. ZODW24 TaxID=2185142 RepID=UPI001F071E0F|nr:molecular chaperone [Altererythrobacter sp. ZODW24]
MTSRLARFVTRTLLPVMATAAMFMPGPLAAQGDLLVAPTRVILDGSRGTQVILSNIGQQEATYRIGLELRRMTKEGKLEDVSREDANAIEQAALGMIRYAPRRIKLAPGQPQAVRISARPGAELPDGEYRVHMSFKAIPEARPVTPADANAPASGISIQLIPIYGVTIPVIVRKGRLEAVAAIQNPQIVAGPSGQNVLTLDLARQGESSMYGEIRVMKQGQEEPIYLARGVAVYSELSERTVRMGLNSEQAAAMRGPVRIEYREMPEKGGDLITSVDTVIG